MVATGLSRGGTVSSTRARTPAAVLTDLQVCQTAFANPNPGSSTGINNMKMFRWAEDMGGMTSVHHDRTADLDSVFVHLLHMNTSNNNATDGQYQNANSNHPGGANFLFADGSVHFVKSSINMKTYWALGTKAKGEVLSSDSY